MNVEKDSRLQRCELLLTDRCNFKCKYCRGMRKDIRGTLDYFDAMKILQIWVNDGLRCVRFSGGEPTLYRDLPALTRFCSDHGVEKIAVSTNGSQDLDYYKHLMLYGVNDFSISLDSGCCSVSENMSGATGSWEKVVSNIRELSKLTYVTVGMVFTEENAENAIDSIKYADMLGVADIRIISSAQYNKALSNLQDLDPDIRKRHPILNYRINNYLSKRNVRGLRECDCNKCYLVLDDIAVAKDCHFPCIIYLREHGNPIGKVSKDMREERFRWFLKHDTKKDPICSKNCLDVCVDHNNKVYDHNLMKEW